MFYLAAFIAVLAPTWQRAARYTVAAVCLSGALTLYWMNGVGPKFAEIAGTRIAILVMSAILGFSVGRALKWGIDKFTERRRKPDVVR